jgi:hypothetical protein
MGPVYRMLVQGYKVEEESDDTKVKISIRKEDVVKYGRELIKLLEIAKKEIESISEAMGELSFADLARVLYTLEQDDDIPNDIAMQYADDEKDELIAKMLEYQQAMHRIGGIILRNSVGDVMNQIITKIDKPWHTRVIEKLTSPPYDLDPKTAKKFSENFTGKKNVPNFEEMKKTARDMIAAGIDSELFFKIYEESYMILDQLLDEKLDKENALYRAVVERYLEYNLLDKKVTGKKRDDMLKAVADLYEPLIAVGVKEFDNLVELEKSLSRAQSEAEEYREKINEVIFVTKLVEALV